MRQLLPIAESGTVRRYAVGLLRRHPRDLGIAVVLHMAAAVAGLVAPRLIGNLVQAVSQGTTLSFVNKTIIAIGAFLLVQTVLTRFARYVSFALGEKILAELREDFVEQSLALPVSTVEKAGTGDLLTRSSRDVEALGWSVRFALPETMIAMVTTVFTIGACVLVGAWVLVPLVLGVPVLFVATRWYLKRAKDGYLRESASYAGINASVAETADGARTVEALGLEQRRLDRIDADIAESYSAERYTLYLRTMWFPAMEVGYLLPTVVTLLFGGWLHLQGYASLGDVTAATLYVQALIDPVDRLISWLDEFQVGSASLARLLGVGQVPDDRTPSGRQPTHEHIDADDVRFAYAEGRDVLHGVDLHVRRGERVAMVGPSGAGKSTLGRLLAGIHPPGSGAVTVGDVGLTELPLDDLRGHVSLVTQEHHVFVGTLRDNLALAVADNDGGGNDGGGRGRDTVGRASVGGDAVGGAGDARLWDALAAVDALGWAEALPAGLDTRVGSGGHPLTPAQAQQVALARLVLADPHTLVLDEATSLIDPRAARNLERSLGAVLHGRTVVAIAHRLFTAHDADRVAVVEDGRIAEIGSHQQLMDHNGSYAALWRSWHGDS